MSESRTNNLVEWVELTAAVGIEEVNFALEAKTHEDSDAMVGFFRTLLGMCMDGNVIKSLNTTFANTVAPEGYLNHVDVKIGFITE